MRKLVKEEKIADIVVALCIFTIHVWGFWNYDVPIILLDEFSYWEHAASFAGYDWLGVMDLAPWYSFGYSLLLTPLFYICRYMSTMYHMAILINGVMIIGIYFIIKGLLRRFYPESPKGLDIAAAMTVSLYSGYVGQSKVAWAEIALYFSFWLLLLCFAIWLEKEKFSLGICVSFLAGIIYIIHNRMIVVIIALYMTAILMKCRKKVSWGMLPGLILPAAFLYIWNDWIKSILQCRLLAGIGLEYSMNDIASRIWKLKAFFSAEGLRNGIKTALGQLVYINLSTFTIGITGICCMAGIIVRNWKSSDQKDTNKFFFSLFVFLVFFGEWGISTLANMPLDDDIGNKSVTYLYYGRYTDAVIGIIILCGLMYLIYHLSGSLLRKIIAGNLVVLAGTIVVYKYSKFFDNQPMKSMSIPGMWYADRIDGLNVVIYTLLIDIIMLAVMYFFLFVEKKWKCGRSKLFFCGIITIFFLTVGISYSIVRIGAYRQPKEGIFRWLERNAEQAEVYCFANENAKYYTQAELYDRTVRIITEEDVCGLKKGNYIVAQKELEQENLRLCMKNERYYIYMIIDNQR